MDAAVRLRALAGDGKQAVSEEEALRREITVELHGHSPSTTHLAISKRTAGDESLPLLSSPLRPANGHSHQLHPATPPSTHQQRFPARWVLLLSVGWLLCMLLGLHLLDYINVSSTSSWLTSIVPLHYTTTLFHALKATAPSQPTPPTTPEPSRPPPLCSLAHLKPIAAHLYATTPIESLPYNSLPNLTSLHIDPATFRSSSTYNPLLPSQLYHNVCIAGRTANHVMIFTGKDGLNATEKQRMWDERREKQLLESGEQGHTLWRHYWFGWRWEDEVEAGWRWLAGTTVIERKMAIYHDRSWNFGHMFADFIVPYTMHYINQQPLGNSTLTRLTHHIDRIIIHNGCIEPASPYPPAPPLLNPFAPPVLSPLTNSTEPAVYSTATVDTVWPVDCPAAAPFHWMMRMMMRTYSGEGRLADGAVLDQTWHGLRVAAMWNKSETAEQCVEDHFDETVCFERLLIIGRQEDRDNTRAPEWENRRAFWVIRNVTMQTMGIGQPVHIAWKASEMDESERRKIRGVLARDAAIESTMSAQMYTASLNRSAQAAADDGVVPVAAASHRSFVTAEQPSPSVPAPRPRVLLYGRQDADRRLWHNVGETMRVLSRLSSISLTYLQTMHDLSLCEQMLLFSQHDIFIMPKGAALFGTLWAPPHSLVLELYPTAGVDWTWLRMIIEGLQLQHVRVDSSRRADCPGGPATQRPGGQDDCFETDAAKVLSVLENNGVDVSDGWRLLNMTAPRVTAAAG